MSLISPLDDLRDVLHESPIWGIDPSTRRYALTVLLPTGFELKDSGVASHMGDGWAMISQAMPSGDEAPRLWAAHDMLLSMFRLAISEWGFPVFTVLEQPFARPGNIHPQSWYFVGVGLAALAQAQDGTGLIDTMGPSEWKKPALGAGKGATKKPGILRWAREELGYTGECPKCGTGRTAEGREIEECKHGCAAHDEVDSLGIAVAAARRWAERGTEAPF
jgi:hypothetical protein